MQTVAEIFGSRSKYRTARQCEVEWAATKDPAQRPALLTIPCRIGSGHLYQWSPTVIAYIGRGMSLRSRLLAIDGVRSWQTGDDEFAVTFPVSALRAVAAVVRPRTRKVVSAEHLAKMQAGLANHKQGPKPSQMGPK